MNEFKRNQIEDAVALLFGRRSPQAGVTLHTRLKRLLETDRKLAHQPRSSNPERANYAFFRAEAPGSGVEIWFSHYESFALCTAWRLLEHGWPQSSAVSILRRARPQLERKHSEILTWDPERIFDSKTIHESARPGSPYVATSTAIYLVIASRSGPPLQNSLSGSEVTVLDEKELMKFMKSEVGLFLTNFELVRTAHELRRALENTIPVRRGRGNT